LPELKRWWESELGRPSWDGRYLRGRWRDVSPAPLRSALDGPDSVLRFQECALPSEGRLLAYHHDSDTMALSVYGSVRAEQLTGAVLRACDLSGSRYVDASAGTIAAPGGALAWQHASCAMLGVEAVERDAVDRGMEAMRACARASSAGTRFALEANDAEATAIRALESAFDMGSHGGRAREVGARACALSVALAHPETRSAVTEAAAAVVSAFVRVRSSDEWDMLATCEAQARTEGPRSALAGAACARWSLGPLGGEFGRVVVFGKAAHAFARVGDRFFDFVGAAHREAPPAVGRGMLQALMRDAHFNNATRLSSLLFAVDAVDALPLCRATCAACPEGVSCVRARPVLRRGAALVTAADLRRVSRAAVASNERTALAMIDAAYGAPCFGAMQLAASGEMRGAFALQAEAGVAGRRRDKVEAARRANAFWEAFCLRAMARHASAGPPLARALGFASPLTLDAEMIDACANLRCDARIPTASVPGARVEAPGLHVLNSPRDNMRALRALLPRCLGDIVDRSAELRHPSYEERKLIGSQLVELEAFRPLFEQTRYVEPQRSALVGMWMTLFDAREGAPCRGMAPAEFLLSEYGRFVDDLITMRSRGITYSCAFPASRGMCPFSAACSDGKRDDSCMLHFRSVFGVMPRYVFRTPRAYVNLAAKIKGKSNEGTTPKSCSR